ncbi:hypothetical protein E4U55_006170 [Claviceps digitariae]|nr:hypothetical protein E4U55_006170 [Claviceps digitariae]
MPPRARLDYDWANVNLRYLVIKDADVFKFVNTLWPALSAWPSPLRMAQPSPHGPASATPSPSCSPEEAT